MSGININTIKGKLTRWSRESAEWYERASQYTGYHQKIWSLIQPYFHSSDMVCELACGTGTMARQIAPFVHEIIANDVDPDAIAHCAEQMKLQAIDNMRLIQGDWKIECTSSYDIILFSFFSAFRQDWELLKSRCRRHVIAILPSDALIGNGHLMSRRETAENACQFLKDNEIPYKLIPLTIDFGQPFSGVEEAQKYIKYYYEIESEDEINRFIAEKMQQIENGLYFPKIKEIGIIIADCKAGI